MDLLNYQINILIDHQQLKTYMNLKTILQIFLKMKIRKTIFLDQGHIIIQKSKLVLRCSQNQRDFNFLDRQ
jgi:hypothetical protein